MEAVVRHAELAEELEGDVDAWPRPSAARCGAVFPGEGARAGAERVVAGVAEGVPVAHREAQVLGHGLVADALARVVDLEGQRIVGVLALERDAADAGEVFFVADEVVECSWGFPAVCLADAESSSCSVDRCFTAAGVPGSAGRARGMPPPAAASGVQASASSLVHVRVDQFGQAMFLRPFACRRATTGPAARRRMPRLRLRAAPPPADPNTSATICRQAALLAPPPVSTMRSKCMPADRKAS